MPVITQENRQARIDTPLGEDVLVLHRFNGTEVLSKTFSYSAIVYSEDYDIDGDCIIGKRVSCTYFDEDGRQRHFNGFVSRFEYNGQVHNVEDAASYRMEIVPWLWFLKHNVDCRIFQEKSSPDIIKEVFQNLGFNDFRQELTESYPSREYCVQYRESDFNFVSRLMEEEGIFFYFEHTKDTHTLVMCDSPSGYYQLDEPHVQFETVGQDHFQHLASWQHVYEFRPGTVSQKDFNFKKPTDALSTSEKSKVKFDGSSKLEVYQYPGFYDESDKGGRLTKVRLEEMESQHDHVVGSGYYLTFAPGGKFDIYRHSRPSEEGKCYALVEVYTEFHSNIGFGTSEYGPDFRNEFRCIPVETTFRPDRVTPKPVVEGPQSAVVTTDGQEIVVDEHARVKVQFHWDRYGKKDVNSSCWIRVSQVHAGKGWGKIDIPRQHEEVIVSFLEGDPDRPLITGRVYNGDNQPPFSLKGAGDNAKNKTRRGYTTRTYDGGGFNELTMDDTEGEEEIRIHAQYNMNSVVQHDQTLHVKNNRTKNIDINEEMAVGNDQSLSVGNDRSTSVSNNHSEEVGADQTASIGSNQSTTVGANRSTSVAGNQSTSVGGSYSLSVSSGGTSELGASSEIIVAQDCSEQVGMKKTVVVGTKSEHTAGTEIKISAGMSVTIEAGAMLELKVGASKISMNPGMITISAPLVKIN